MISVEIEKEINQENKVMFDMNLRQIICVIILVAITVVLYVFFKLETEILIYPIIFVAVILYAFGWYKSNGLPFEKVLFKEIQSFIYGSNTRKYKTKNQYVTMVNEEYNRRKNIDMLDKKLCKEIKKEQRIKQKELKKAQKTSISKPIN